MQPRSLESHEEVVIIGGGLIGLCAAFSLMRRGHSVTVIEQRVAGSGAARGNAGEITPLSALPLPAPGMLKEVVRGLRSRRHYLSIDPFALPGLAAFGMGFIRNSTAGRLAGNTRDLDQLVRGAFAAFDAYGADGIGLGGGGTGFLYTHSDTAAAAAFRQGLVARAELLGMRRPEPLLEGAALRERHPMLGDAVGAGFLAPEERFLDPGVFSDELARALTAGGVTILERSEAVGLDLVSTRPAVIVRRAAGTQRIAGSRIVIAGGAWSAGLVPRRHGRRPVIVPGRGYSFSVQPDHLPTHLIAALDRRTVAIPMSGRLRLVGLMDFGGGTDRFETTRVQHLADQASTFLRGIDWSARTEEWVGPRPMTPNGLPVISPLPSDSRVIVATGHNMHGLSLGPVTGEVTATLVEGRAPSVAGVELDMRPFSLS